jgi:hypothetical protein
MSTSQVQSGIRRRLRKAPFLRRRLQAARALVHFGPWRHFARWFIRKTRPPLVGPHPQVAVLNRLDKASAVAALRQNGVAIVGLLKESLLYDLCTTTDQLPPGEYGAFHEECETAQHIVQSEDVLSVVRGYLAAEPVLLECTLVVHRPEDINEKIVPQRRFHFDYAGWDSLNLFIYLTDVTAESGAHQFVAGTHRYRLLKDAVRAWVPDEEIHQRYNGRVVTVTGSAGTCFFESTEGFHRRMRMTERRVMLNVLYASHQSWLSGGRLTRKYADYLQAKPAVASVRG